MLKLWLAKIDWSEPLPEKVWNEFVSTLLELENLKIPRFVYREEHINIHGFSDAFSLTYGAALYIQSMPVEDYPAA